MPVETLIVMMFTATLAAIAAGFTGAVYAKLDQITGLLDRIVRSK